MLDIVKLAREFKIELLEGRHHHATSGWKQLSCPFCSPSGGGWHLGFNLQFGNFSCWRCGALRLKDVVSLLTKIRDAAQVREIIKRFQIPGNGSFNEEIIRKETLELPQDCGPLLPAHRKYLRSRSFDPEALEKQWGLMGTGRLGGSWAWRVVVPIRAGDDSTVAYQGRAISDEVAPKYRMTDNADCLIAPDSILYGIDKVQGDSIVIVEGVTGVWRIGPGTVATLGIKWRKDQLNLLRRFTNRYIIYDDKETDAQKRANLLGSYLALFPGHTEVVDDFDGKDPGTFDDATVRSIRKHFKLI